MDSNITLWQFLLELLVQGENPNLIQWTNNEGEFKVSEREREREPASLLMVFE